MALRADVDMALLARYWWVFALRGVLAITFGVLAALMPELTLTALVLLFGSYAIIEGGFNVIAAIRRRRDQPLRWMLLLEGLVSVAVGAITFFLPLTVVRGGREQTIEVPVAPLPSRAAIPALASVSALRAEPRTP